MTGKTCGRKKSLSATSASAVKWSFVKRFDTTEDCLEHLGNNRFVSVVTSPHISKDKTTSSCTKETIRNITNWRFGSGASREELLILPSGAARCVLISRCWE